MIYDPPRDYYKLIVGCRTIEVFPFSLDSDAERARAYQACRDWFDRIKDRQPRDRYGHKRMRIVRWANGNLFQVFPEAKPAALRLVGTEIADAYGPN
jgi:hypothetical protein